MNAALCLTTLFAVVCLSGAMTPKYKERLVSSLTDCMKMHNVEKEEVIELMKNDKVPEDKEKRCIGGCTMEKMGYIKDLEMNWDVLKKDLPDKFDTPELVEKGNQVVDACAKIVTKKEDDHCELGVKALKCIHEHAVTAQIPPQDFSFD